MFNDENDVRHEATSDGHGNTLNDVVYFCIHGCVYEIRYMF